MGWWRSRWGGRGELRAGVGLGHGRALPLEKGEEGSRLLRSRALWEGVSREWVPMEAGWCARGRRGGVIRA